ncbi:aminoacyl-histidine dipeptidase [Leminorella grimontii]|uniref:Cytosol non-specific dipeptidase n=1 Tax=Leminorella grimontii TaxID=82981 RepID=A0AAV5N4K4_9GAMM|nr:aminoacyl-histidine dipeptidase [Leminorella grimontii]KFC97115.1 aminoacyl-histidine dipeptidase [Leminorella grimontii ATCC 33999 = DSM 5078]GKX57041.1 aminoacyl-histidine dipeptidase [Leminorella grimontii]GKX58838.1 aminoacyl-histidine dipeptidase [Leminorella grimontii]VFS57247.1 Cytosol non-specific dipeptidase [Leminorella grimontii]
MSDLSQLTPQHLWQHFATICSIPHPSKHEEALAQHIVSWAKERKLFAERDAVGNILIRKPATPGMENRKSVVLQAHLDMVPQKNNDTEHDFEKDPIQPYVDGQWLKARGTTLGSDNGIGMASALAVLSDESLVHGPIEVLLTMTEETGMDGAFGLQPNWLKSEILINTDSETEGEIYMGCAGGVDCITTLPLSREALPAGYETFKISLKGLKGGHSGGDIHLGLGNANKLMARFLAAQTSELELRLLSFTGGTLRNAIPREATLVVAVPQSKVGALKQAAADYLTLIGHELSAVEKGISLQVDAFECGSKALTQDSQNRLVGLVNASPNGVMRMSDSVKGVVETSLNVGVVTTEQDCAQVLYLIRSLIDSGKQYVVEVLMSLGQLAGAEVKTKGGYPGWEPNPESPVMNLVSESYKKLFDTTPHVMVIHAGLECGLFKRPYPDMDMVSIGPTITGAHSPDEQVHIPSVSRYWQLLTQVLKSIPEKG